MKEITALILILFLEFIKYVGWAVFVGLFVFISFEFCKFAFGYTSEFYFFRAVLILGSLLLILFIAHKLPNWLFKNTKEKIELKEWR